MLKDIKLDKQTETDNMKLIKICKQIYSKI